MIARLFRGVLVAATVVVSIPYTVAVVSNILKGWPQRKDKYARALNPKKVLGLNYVLYQMIKDKSKFIFLFLKWKQYYRNADHKKLIKNVPYGRNDRFLDVHLSKKSSGKTPVIIFVYGGSWNSGSKGMYGLLAHQLVSRTNSIVVSPDYSTYPKGYVDDMVQDVVDCISWVVENIDRYGGDLNKIILMGHSSGAHLCALTILELLRNERISVASSFKFEPAGGLDELSFAESHYGRLSKMDKWREGLEDSSGSSESFAVVSENGSMADNGGSNNGLDASTSSIGVLSASMNAESMESSTLSESFVKAGESEGLEGEEDIGIAIADETLGSGDHSHSKIKSESRGDDIGDDSIPPTVSQAESGSVGDDEEEADDDSGDNDSIVTVRQKDIDRQVCLSDLCKSIKAFIGLAGVYSIGDHFQHESMRGIEDVSCMARAFYGEDHFDRFSPVEIVQRVGRSISFPPTVLVHGTDDYIVPTSSSTNFAEALAKISANIKLKLIPDCPHYEICLDLMDRQRKFHNHVMNIVLETLNVIS